MRFNRSPGGSTARGGFKNIYGFIYKGPRYWPLLNPGEMIYFLLVCGADPPGVAQRAERPRAGNLRWLQRLIKGEWINLEHDINNTTVTSLLKLLLLSINFPTSSVAAAAAAGRRPNWWLRNADLELTD